MNISTRKTVFETDTFTPVGIFLNLRNHFSKIALLESNDYKDRTQSKSFICADPIAEIRIENQKLSLFVEEKVIKTLDIAKEINISQEIENLLSSFQFEKGFESENGFFGFMGFEFSHFIEKQIEKAKSNLDIPDFQFYIYRYIIVIDHFNNSGYLLENSFSNSKKTENLLLDLLLNKSFTSLYFEKVGEESSSISDSDFLDYVGKAKVHCERGDVFQLVLSRDFQQAYFGDDFEVYRTLRRLNPSPYLFYFDFETHRIFGSSPEAQIKITNSKAEIHPIAGTVKKTGDLEVDKAAISFLVNDKKENAEHTMLVDLARNDLSKCCTNIKIEAYKEIQQFSHVIHLVSKVCGELKAENNSFNLIANTFPAGTLSGTPKPKALELISKYENTSRDYYGGAIGFISAGGDANLAIVIRSILSKNKILNYRAGAGIVIHSNETSELKEVENKLAAVRKAINEGQKSVKKELA